MKTVTEIALKLYLLEGQNHVWRSRAKKIFGDVDLDPLHRLFYNSGLVIMEDLNGMRLTYGQISMYDTVAWYIVDLDLLEFAQEKNLFWEDCWKI